MITAPPPLWWYRARLVVVHDGDTVRLDLDRGFDDTLRASVRLDGLNAPELIAEAGPAARDFVAGWFAVHVDHWVGVSGLKVEWPFLVRTWKREKFGRALGAALWCGLSHSLNDDLVASGNAVRVKYS